MQLFHSFLRFRIVFGSVFFVIIFGVIGGFMAAASLSVLILLYSKKNGLEFLFTLTIITFFLGDNSSGPLAFMQNFRFVLLLIGILYLLKYKLIKNSIANYLLPFTIIALFTTLLFSPLGIAVVLRSLGFWLVGLVIFKLANLLYLNNTNRASELLVLVLVLYFTVNLIFVFIPFEGVYLNERFRGLTGNPNGLGMIAMFSFGIITLIEKRKDIIFKKTFLALKILFFYIIFITGSRTAFFSVLFFQLIFIFHKYRLFLYIFMLIFVFCFLFSDYILNSSYFNNFLSLDFLRINTLTNASGRTDVWPVAWEEIKNSPFLGNGILYDDYFMKDYVSINIGENASRHWSGVWNSYLSLLLDVGIIGSIAYAYFWIQAFRKSHYKNLAIAFVFMCLISGFTESWMAASMNAFTPMMFLFWAIQSQHAINK
jgi:O-antigen ligase